MAKINYYLKRPIESLSYSFCKWRVRALAKKYFQIDILGLENLPKESAILVANHEIGLDAGLLGSAIPKKIHYLVQNEGLYNSGLKFILWTIGQIPVNVDKRSSNKQVVKRSRDYLSYSKDYLGIFGEGPTKYLEFGGRPTPLSKRNYQLGAAHFAINFHRKVIPVILAVPEEIVAKLWCFPWAQRENKFRELDRYIEKNGKIPYIISICPPIEGTDKRELTDCIKREINKEYLEIKRRL